MVGSALQRTHYFRVDVNRSSSDHFLQADFTGLFVPDLRSMGALAILSASAKGSALVWSRSVC